MAPGKGEQRQEGGRSSCCEAYTSIVREPEGQTEKDSFQKRGGRKEFPVSPTPAELFWGQEKTGVL